MSNTTRQNEESKHVSATSEKAFLQSLQHLESRARQRAIELGLDWSEVMQEGPDRHTPAKQGLVLLSLGLFDEAFYLSTYPDIAAAGLEPIVHYVNFGDAEGRRPNEVFDPAFYRGQFGADKLQSVSALYHYAVMGEALGLKASNTFSPRRYLVSNPDLQPWLDRPLSHFLQLGKAAGLMVNHRARLSGSQKVRFEATLKPAPRRYVNPAAGINVIGPLDRISGLGVSARGYLDGLQRAGFEHLGCQAQQREFAIQSSIQTSTTFPAFIDDAAINVVHMNGDTLPVMIENGGARLFENKYNIAVWYWELPTLRPEWQASMKYFHEFWAPTPFIYRAIRQSTAKPVHLLPPYLAYLNNLALSAADRSDATRFVYCFDANSILERKNPSALVDAFQSAFPRSSNERVELVFKITYPNKGIEEVSYLYAAQSQDDRIRIIDHLLSDEELHGLIGSASAYVSPHRSEGLGLTVIEAMGAGVPVICTPFGGVDTFVDDHTAYPLDFDLVELAGDYPPYPRGFVWANPRVKSIADKLLAVHRDPAEAKRKAVKARARVMEYFCSDVLIGRYKEKIARISVL